MLNLCKPIRLVFFVIISQFSWFVALWGSDYNQFSETQLKNSMDSISSNNYLVNNFNKYINLYQLQIFGKAEIRTQFGDISLLQNYNGNYLKLTDLSLRDDQNWNFTYRRNLFDKISMVAVQNFILVSDNRNIGINQLSRLNGLIGLEITNDTDYSFSALAGLENNKLLGINSQGQVYSIKATWNHFAIDNLGILGNLSANWLKLNLNRVDRDLFANLKVIGRFSDDGIIQTDINYKYLQNNLLSIATNSEFTPIETRQENYINPKLTIDYKIAESVSLFLDFNLNLNKIQRQYKQSWEQFDYSYFRRNIDQMDLTINSGLSWQWNLLNHFLSFGFWSRNESNVLELSDRNYKGDLLKYQNIENQRDYRTNKFNLLNQSTIKLSKNTNIQLNYNVYLLQYDTPSKQNFDDRDEFSSIFRVAISRRFSDYTNLDIAFENIANHLVYLSSQRSAMNNWNKIYRLSPKVRYQNSILQINPQLEVLANYTIYDFESKSSVTKSISLRNISYRDSIIIDLTSQIQNRIQIKYQLSERSLLNWHEFSEYPQVRLNEFFIKSLLIRKYDYCEIGVGCNLFNYIQTKLQENTIDYDITSVSPEVLILYRWKDWQLKFVGWYEFQYQNNNKINEIANLNILINLFF